MPLTPARPLAPFQGEDEEIELGRRPRRNRQQRRRRERGRPPKGPRNGRSQHPHREQERPRGRPQRQPSPGRRHQPQNAEPPPRWNEPESDGEYEPHEALQPLGDPASAALALEGRLRRRRRFTSAATVSPNLKIETAEGTRAAVIPLRPGLYLVAEVSEAALNSPNVGGPEVGAIAIATAAMTAARAAMNVRQRRLEQGKQPVVAVLRDKLANGDGTLRERLASVRTNLQDGQGQGLVARFRDGDGPLRERLFHHPEPSVRIPEGTPGQLLPEPIPTWAEPEDQAVLAGLFGDCGACRGDCRNCRRRSRRY